MTATIVPLNSVEACDAGRFGPKAANQAILVRAGLPVPDGFCIDAEAYREQVSALGLWEAARGAFGAASEAQMRRFALAMRLGLLDKPIIPQVLEPLLEARRALIERTGALVCVRSSALVEDR
ncbi:MAG: phosphoenolpyruvate synthase, partial [Betaproteobacteria bacterium]